MKPEIVGQLVASNRHACNIEKLLQDYIPDRQVWVFGSRAFGSARRYSDLVDLVDLNDVSETFRAHVEPYFVSIQEPTIDRA